MISVSLDMIQYWIILPPSRRRWTRASQRTQCVISSTPYNFRRSQPRGSAVFISSVLKVFAQQRTGSTLLRSRQTRQPFTPRAFWILRIAALNESSEVAMALSNLRSASIEDSSPLLFIARRGYSGRMSTANVDACMQPDVAKGL